MPKLTVDLEKCQGEGERKHTTKNEKSEIFKLANGATAIGAIDIDSCPGVKL